jgi:hypothetical protein
MNDLIGIRPEDIHYHPFIAFSPAVGFAILVGHPATGGPYVARMRVPAGVKIMPHRNPEDRVYTVIDGVLYIGRGETFGENGLDEYPRGSVVVVPGGVSHYQWAKNGEVITQMTAVAPPP